MNRTPLHICPHCNKRVGSVITKVMTVNGETGFVFFCPLCDNRITKEELNKMEGI